MTLRMKINLSIFAAGLGAALAVAVVDPWIKAVWVFVAVVNGLYALVWLVVQLGITIESLAGKERK